MKAPTLKELKERPCSSEELQATLVQLIEHHNALSRDLQAMADSGRIRSRNEVMMETPYGLTK